MKKTALLPLLTYPEPFSREALAAAVDFASRAEFDLFALSLEADFPRLANALSSLLLDVPEMIRKAEAQSHADGEASREAVAKLAAQSGVGIQTGRRRDAPELAGDVAAEEARYFDLALVPAPQAVGQSKVVAEAIVFGSGRPTILIPGKGAAGNLRRAVLAWDGSRVAARAVNDLFSLFGEMEQVTILSVLNEKPLPEDDPGDKLAAHLAKRGVSVRALAIELEDQPIGATLQDFAIQDGAGLLAMGAYGHSRLREFVLGGATRTIMDDVRLPVLMSH